MKEITPQLIADLSPFCEQGKLVAFDIAFDDSLYLAFALEPLDYTMEQPGWALFSKTRPERPQTYRIVAFREGRSFFDLTIRNEQFNIHHVQPLPGEILLVCSRSYWKSPAEFERNGRVYGLDGTFLREILLGDGIRTVQTTANGTIWTSYFDEGIGGNYGWNDPVGSSGLVAWDPAGQKCYEFTASDGLEAMDDCYALNVVSETDVWCCYYHEFPLVHIREQAIAHYWLAPVHGSHAFAVSHDRALFSGGYDAKDDYVLCSLESKRRTNVLEIFQLKNAGGETIVADLVAGRGSALHVLSGNSVYRVDIDNLTKLV